MLEAVIGELAAAALLRMGRQIETAARSNRHAVSVEELRMSDVLGSFNFETSALRLDIELPRGVTESSVAQILASPQAEAISFEVLALVLTESLTPARARVADHWKSVVVRAEPAAADVADRLLDAVVAYYEIAVGIARDDFPNAYARLKDDSRHRRIACVLEAIHQSLQKTQPIISLDEVEEFSQLYRRQVRQGHKYITPPDFDRRKDVAIEDLYVSPTILAPPSATREGNTVEDLLREIDRTVLLGDPGNGKSTASHVLLYEAAQLSTAPLPFLVVLREFAGAGLDRSVVEYLEDRLSKVYQCRPPEGFVEHVLETGKALVVFDGLDELLDTSHRRQVTDAVSLFCNRYPLVRTLVTSRRVGYHQAPMDKNQFAVLELSGFDRDQVEEYVAKWFRQLDLDADQVAAWTEAFMRESDSVSDLTSTPLLLALMCIIYRGERSLPRNRPAVYERCATMLFDKWDGSRGIQIDLRAGQLVDPAMKHLAYWLFSQDAGDGVTESALVRETTSYLHERSFELEADAEAAAREFVEFCRGRAWVFSDVGTTPDGEALYKFTHRTFLEYFAAYHLSRTIDTPERLARTIGQKVANAEWDVVAQLAVQIADRNSDRGANRIFDALLNETRRRAPHKRANIVAFLTRCLSFVHLSPTVLRQLVRESLVVLVSTAPGPGGSDPLETLLTNSHFLDEEIIENELRTNLEQYVQGEDIRHRGLALSLISGPTGVLKLAHIDTDARWRPMFNRLEDQYRLDYEQEFGKNLEFSALCLRRGWGDLSDYLNAFDMGLDSILLDTPIGYSSSTAYVGYGRHMLVAAIWGNSPWGAVELEQFSEVADYAEELVDRGQPLCTDAQLHIWNNEKVSPVLTPDLTDRQLLGAGILLACLRETSRSIADLPEGWGRLEPMVKWLGRRGTEEAEVPVAWAPEDAFSVLYRWVRGELNFSPARRKRPGSSVPSNAM